MIKNDSHKYHEFDNLMDQNLIFTETFYVPLVNQNARVDGLTTFNISATTCKLLKKSKYIDI